MKAVFYDKDAVGGICMKHVPYPSMKTSKSSEIKQDILRWVQYLSGNLVLSFLFLVLQILFSIVHFLRLLGIKWLPQPYGYNPNRRMVLCRIHSVGINPVDAKRLYGDKVPRWANWLLDLFIQNKGCGLDFSGVVLEAPIDSGFKKDDHVFGTVPPFSGSLAEHVRVPCDFIARKPHNLYHKQAAVVPLVGLTALQIIEDYSVDDSKRVLVIGASGGTGHCAVQIAKIKGASVTGICSSKNAAFVKSLGANHVIEYDAGDNLIQNLRDLVLDEGKFDLIIDTVSSINEAIDAVTNSSSSATVKSYHSLLCDRKETILASNGKYIQTGGSATQWLFAHIQRYLGLQLWSFGNTPGTTHAAILFWVRFPLATHYLNSLCKYCEEEKLKIKVDEVLPFTLDGITKAFDKMHSRRTVGKIVIDLGVTEAL